MRIYWLVVFALGIVAAIVMAVRSLLWPRLRASWREMRARRQQPIERMPADEIAFAFERRPEAFEPYRRRGTISEDELIEEMASAMLDPRNR